MNWRSELIKLQQQRRKDVKGQDVYGVWISCSLENDCGVYAKLIRAYAFMAATQLP